MVLLECNSKVVLAGDPGTLFLIFFCGERVLRVLEKVFTKSSILEGALGLMEGGFYRWAPLKPYSG